MLTSLLHKRILCGQEITLHTAAWDQASLGGSLLKWSLPSATNNLMHEEREGGDVTISNGFHLPVQIGTLISTALCDFLLLSYLFRWCDFTFGLSKYHREISCKQGDMTFLQDACLAICFGVCRQCRQVEQMVCLSAPGVSHALYSLARVCYADPDPSGFQ